MADVWCRAPAAGPGATHGPAAPHPPHLAAAPLMSDGKQSEGRRCDSAPVITHSPLLSPPQTFLSNRTGHGQLRHVPEQRMHYLQVGGHFSSEAAGDTNVACRLSLREGAEVEEETAGRRERAPGLASNVDSFNEHTWTFPHRVLSLMRRISPHSVCECVCV